MPFDLTLELPLSYLAHFDLALPVAEWPKSRAGLRLLPLVDIGDWAVLLMIVRRVLPALFAVVFAVVLEKMKTWLCYLPFYYAILYARKKPTVQVKQYR